MNTRLKLNLNFGKFNGAMNVNIRTTNQHIASIIDPVEDSVIIDTTISLPCNLIFSLSGKNPNDTKVVNGTIVADKYVQLSALSLGYIPVSDDVLFKICKFVTNNSVVYDTFWGFNGEVSIDFNEQEMLLWHLKQNNKFKL